MYNTQIKQLRKTLNEKLSNNSEGVFIFTISLYSHNVDEEDIKPKPGLMSLKTAQKFKVTFLDTCTVSYCTM